MGGSCVDRFPHLRNPDGQRKRNALKLKMLKKRQQLSNAHDEICQPVSAIKPCKHFANGKGVCPFGSKCFFSHAIIKPKLITSGPKVAAEIYFKSLPVDAMTEQDMRQMADQWGTHCTGVRFIGDGRNPMCPGRIAGKVFMDNEAAAWSFLEELDNKLFVVENNHGKQRVYVKAKMEKLEKVSQPITAQTASHTAVMKQESMFTGNFVKLSPKMPGKQTVANQLQNDHDFALMMQKKYEYTSNTSATNKMERFKLAVFDWPSLPAPTSVEVVEVQQEIHSEAPAKESSSKSWHTVTHSRKHRSIYAVLQADSSDDESTPDEPDATPLVEPKPTLVEPTPVEPTPVEPKLVEATTPLVSKKQLKLLDWFEFERERLEQRAKDKMAKAAWSTMVETETQSDEGDTCVPVDEVASQPQPENSQPEEEEEELVDSEDDDENAYFDDDDSKNIERLKWLLPAKYRSRFS